MTVQCQATVTAEVLTRLARPVFRGGIDLDAVTGRVFELVVPDGAVGMPLVLSVEGAVHAVVVQTDAPLLLWLGGVDANTPLSLQAYGSVALLGSDLAAAQGVSVTYAPGTGVPAHLVVYVAGSLTLVLPEPPEPPEPWQWIVRYQEPFDYTVAWTQRGSYLDTWDSVTWGSFESTKPWNLVEPQPVTNPLTNVAVLDTTTPIVPPTSLRLQMGHIVFGGSTRNDGVALGAYGGSPPFATINDSDVSSGRLRTLLRMETPPIIAGATGVHVVGAPWYSGGPAVGGGADWMFTFDLIVPVNAGVITGWRFGVYQGQAQYGTGFSPITTGTFATPIPTGTTYALEIECRHERVNAKFVHSWVRFGPGTSFSALPVLVDFLWVKGDVEVTRLPVGTFTSGKLLRFNGFAAQPTGTCVFTIDQTELVWTADNASSTDYRARWGDIHESVLGVTTLVDPFTPLNGSGSLRCRRNHQYDTFLAGQPSLLPVGRSSITCKRYNHYAAGYHSTLRGRLQMIVRPTVSAGTRTTVIGLSGLWSDARLENNLVRGYALLYTLDQATGAWTTLSLAYFPRGTRTALPTVLVSMSLPAAALNTPVAFELTWLLDGTAHTLDLEGKTGPSLAALVPRLTWSGADVWLTGSGGGATPQTITFSYGEGPVIIFDYDGASSDFDLDMDDVTFYEQVPA